MVRSISLLLVLVKLLSPIQSTGQTSSCLHRTLPISVRNSKGGSISGLTAADFESRFHGAPVRILSLVPEGHPHRIVLLLDASGSMTETWGQALVSASELAASRLPDTQLALLVFGDKTYEEVDFAQGQQAVAEKIRQMGSNVKHAANLVHGRTALYDALLAGLRLLGTPTSADILYLISDGGDNASHVRSEELVRQLNFSGVRLIVAVVHSPLGYRSRTPEELSGPAVLSELVEMTGGEIFQPFANGGPLNGKEAKQHASLMDAFYSRMIQNYSLELELPTRPDKRREWELKLTSENQEKWKNAQVLYPRALAPCME